VDSSPPNPAFRDGWPAIASGSFSLYDVGNDWSPGKIAHAETKEINTYRPFFAPFETN
jgi:hypothetical protein